jgi:eukaryotic-like serine/threonine-protein kinase
MFQQGQQIGSYTLVRKLGKGGFGEVWLAEKRSQFFTKKVAVKLPHDEQVNFDTIRREAQLWEEASGHPNVLPIIDADVYEGNQVVIVSEYADGGSLADRIKNQGRFSLEQSVEMTAGILNGLEFLHSRNIVHRDIKPANILLQGDTPRLADFGISRAMNTSTVSSVVVGTDSYMAPEAFDGKRNVQTDIWSVGVVLYQLLKGTLPFPQEHPSERMFAVLTKDFEPLPAEIPPALRRIVEKALRKNPSERFQSAREMRDELRNYLNAPFQPTVQDQTDQPTAALPVQPQTTQPESAAKETAAAAVPQPNYFIPPQAQNTDNQSVVTRFHVSPAAETAPEAWKNPAALNKRPNKLIRNELIPILGVAVLIVIGIIVFIGMIDRGRGSYNTNSNYNPSNYYSNSNTTNAYNSNTRPVTTNSYSSNQSMSNMSNYNPSNAANAVRSNTGSNYGNGNGNIYNPYNENLASNRNNYSSNVNLNPTK